jgi:2-oxoisovalerate dehydrogenase E1 component alpha subunit
MPAGDSPDFDASDLPIAGAARRPDVTAPSDQMRDLAYGLIRVLNGEDVAVGSWNPQLKPSTLRRGLRSMLLTRLFDERMFRAQCQGKTTFYMKSTGEEAISCAQAMVLSAKEVFISKCG